MKKRLKRGWRRALSSFLSVLMVVMLIPVTVFAACPGCGNSIPEDDWCHDCGMCIECAISEGLHCPDCGNCGNDYDLCEECGKCGECCECEEEAETCPECGEKYDDDEHMKCEHHEMCYECAYKEGFHCESCGECPIEEGNGFCESCVLCLVCALHAGQHCQQCSNCFDIYEECSVCGLCEICCTCERCWNCFEKYDDDDHEKCESCGLCMECVENLGFHCLECHECMMDVEDFCDVCHMCFECAQADYLHCRECGVCINDGTGCDNCHCCPDHQYLHHCEECGSCFKGEEFVCRDCGKCLFCVPQCTDCHACSCSEVICENCRRCMDHAIEAGLHCNECEDCLKDGELSCPEHPEHCKLCAKDHHCKGCNTYFPDETYICDDCGLCKNCGYWNHCQDCWACGENGDVEICELHHLCQDCAVSGGWHCEECGDCMGDGFECPATGHLHCAQCGWVWTCDGCGECFYDDQDEFCEACGLCISCAVEDVKHCAECRICADGELCETCHLCEDCASDNHCCECGACFEAVERCPGTDHCLECHEEYVCGSCGECFHDNESDFCTACGLCNDCAIDAGNHCVDCNKCGESEELCYNHAGGSYCEECALDAGLHCEICHGCMASEAEQCESGAPHCVDCHEEYICDACGECFMENEGSFCAECKHCIDCAKEDGYHCAGCGACGEDTTLCSEHDGGSWCQDCAEQEGYHCAECGKCYVADAEQCESGAAHCVECHEGYVCEECGDCFMENESDYCSNCQYCIDCAKQAGKHCADCGVCGEDEELCDNHGDAYCQDCAAKYDLHCAVCGECFEEVEQCETNGHCTACHEGWICEDCGECFFEKQSDFCEEHHICIDCGKNQGIHCWWCGTCEEVRDLEYANSYPACADCALLKANTIYATVDNLENAVHGTCPQDFGAVSVRKGAPYTTGNATWTMFNKTLDEMQINDNMTITITFTINKTGRSFNNNTVCYINGVEASKVSVSTDGKTATYKIPYKVPAPVGGIGIDTVKKVIVAPVAGNAPGVASDFKSGSGVKQRFYNDHCTVTSTVWEPADSVFVNGKVYRVTITLEAVTNYKFTENTVFYLNDKVAKVVSVENDTAVISYLFYDLVGSVAEITSSRIAKGLVFPVPGQKAGVSISSLTSYNTAVYAIDTENSCWVDATTGEAMAENDRFAFGGTYYLRLHVLPVQAQYLVLADSVSSEEIVVSDASGTVVCKGGYAARNADGSMDFYLRINSAYTKELQTNAPVRVTVAGGSFNAYALKEFSVQQMGAYETVNGVSTKVVIPTGLEISQNSRCVMTDCEVSIDGGATWKLLASLNGIGFVGLYPNTEYVIKVRVAGEEEAFYETSVTTPSVQAERLANGVYIQPDSVSHTTQLTNVTIDAQYVQSNNERLIFTVSGSGLKNKGGQPLSNMSLFVILQKKNEKRSKTTYAGVPVYAGEDGKFTYVLPADKSFDTAYAFVMAYDDNGSNGSNEAYLSAIRETHVGSNVGTPSAVKIRFDANGGSGSMTTLSVESGTIYELRECVFTAPAHSTFVGWDVDGTTMQPGQQITVTKDVIVKAVWKENHVLFDFYGANMNLGNALDMNFFINASNLKADKEYYVVITKAYADKTDVSTVRVEQSKWQKYNSSLWFVTLKGVSAKEMNDRVTAQVFFSDGTVASNLWEDSVVDYVKRAIKATTADKYTKDLMVDMLRYGAAAQVNFGYDTGNLADAWLEEAGYAGYGQTTATAENKREMGAHCKGSNLNLGSSLCLNVFFENVTNDMYAIVTYKDHNNKEVSYRVNYGKFVTMSGLYGVPVNTLSAADADTLVSITMYNGDGTVYGSAQDSIASYLARMKLTDGSIYTAIKKFCDSANAYFHR